MGVDVISSRYIMGVSDGNEWRSKKEKKSISHFHVYILICSQGIAYEIISEIDRHKT
jgi:hypothetical protein